MQNVAWSYRHLDPLFYSTGMARGMRYFVITVTRVGSFFENELETEKQSIPTWKRFLFSGLFLGAYMAGN